MPYDSDATKAEKEMRRLIGQLARFEPKRQAKTGKRAGKARRTHTPKATK